MKTATHDGAPALAAGHPFTPEDLMAIDARAFAGGVPKAYGPRYGEAPAPYTRSGTIAVLNIRGPLEQYGGYYFDGYAAIRQRFEVALADPAVLAVVLRINSPGGVCSGLFETVVAMQKAKAAAKKPVLAYADEMAYSAAYALACVGDEIWLPPSGGVGSVGAIMVLWDCVKMNEDKGLNVRVIKSGALKALGHPDEPLSDEALTHFQTRANQLAGLFGDAVAKARGMSTSEVLALDAGCFYGKDAVAKGLADGVKSFDDLIRSLGQKVTSTAALAARTENQVMTNFAKMLGLKEDATEAEIATAVEATIAKARGCDAMLAATGAPNVDAAVGRITAGEAAIARVEQLEADAAERAVAEAKRERADLVAQGLRDRKLTPALRAWAEAESTSTESLRSFLAAAPVHPALAGAAPTEPEVRSAAPGLVGFEGKRWEDLKPMEKHRLFTSNQAAYAALRADYQARTGDGDEGEEASEPVTTPEGKRWEDLTPAQKHELHGSDRALYDALRADYERRRRGS